MHQVQLSDSAYNLLSVQASLMGVSVEEVVERYFSNNRTHVGSKAECLGTGQGKGIFSSKEEISAYIHLLRDEWTG